MSLMSETKFQKLVQETLNIAQTLDDSERMNIIGQLRQLQYSRDNSSCCVLTTIHSNAMKLAKQKMRAMDKEQRKQYTREYQKEYSRTYYALHSAEIHERARTKYRQNKDRYKNDDFSENPDN